MDVSHFDYKLPQELIAQEPVEPRDSSRMLHLSSVTSHRQFFEIEDLLCKGDVLIVNHTRVVKASFLGKKPTGGKVTGLFLEVSDEGWVVQLGGKNLKVGTDVLLGNDVLPDDDASFETNVLPDDDVLTLLKDLGEGRYLVSHGDMDLQTFFERHGSMPIPPYIHGYSGPGERYQTVYSKREGAVAAPTAGLHFTPELMKRLTDKGIDIVEVELQVGPGTFAPVRSDTVEGHVMEKERFVIPKETALFLKDAISSNRRCIAVGTTTVRALEASYDSGDFTDSGDADLFIYPGYKFKFPYGGLVTNFHLPKSTLMMLISAYAGRDRMMDAYSEAVAEKYRFYSFGDSMFIDGPPLEVEQ